MTALQLLSARARHAASQLHCTRMEAVAMAVLVAGGLAALGMLWAVARPPSDTPATSARQNDIEDLVVERPASVVHVTGHVVAPGLHRLPPDARVADAIEAAGGPTAQAHLDVLNLARPVSDGEQLRVPSRAEAEAEPSDGSAAAGSQPGGDGTVDLNRATAAELEELPGIGPVLAGRIIEHREANGPFRSVGDLRQVTGVGEKTFQSLADLLSV